MAFYDGVFKALGLSDWCGSESSSAPMSMADLLAQSSGEATKDEFFPFPSLDNLNESCSGIIQSRDVTKGIEEGFLAAKPMLKSILDPITQPLSWLLDGALWTFAVTPWFIMVPILLAISWFASRSVGVIKSIPLKRLISPV